MREGVHRTSLRDWLRIGRLVPLVTIVVALGVGVLSLLGFFQATLAEGIIITLLALLAVDGLVERMSLLEKINERAGSWPRPELLRDRSELIRMEEFAANATEICAAGISLVSIIRPYDGFYMQRLHDGCTLRFLLLDPVSDVFMVWDQGQLNRATKIEIEASLDVMKQLTQIKHVKGRCEVRLSQAYLPFSMVIVDAQRKIGRMTVELLVHNKGLNERPHFQLHRQVHERWFQFFQEQFEQRWQNSKPYSWR